MTITDGLTLGLLLTTAVYAWLTFRMSRAAERSVQIAAAQVEAATRPYVDVSLSIHRGSQVFNLHVRNIGRSAAEHLTLKLDHDFFQNGDRGRKNVAQLPAFQNSINHFGPGASLTFELAQSFAVFGEHADEAIMPTQFVVSVAFTFRGKPYREEHHLDLRPYVDSSLPSDPLVEELERLKDQVEKLVRPLDAIRSALSESLKPLKAITESEKGQAG